MPDAVGQRAGSGGSSWNSSTKPGRKSLKIQKRSNQQLHGRHDEERINRMFVIRKKRKLECEMGEGGLKDVCGAHLVKSQ